MEYLCVDSFSDNQKAIINLKAEGKTYKEISETMKAQKNLNIFAPNISKCLKLSSMGYLWDLHMKPGAKPYLCDKDFASLKDSVQEAAMLGAAMDPIEVLDEAYKLKGERIAYAIAFLRHIKSYELLTKISEKEMKPPCRSWINGVLDQLDAAIKNRRQIDPERILACSTTVVNAFYIMFSNIIRSVPPWLLFNADETMVETNIKTSAVAPRNMPVIEAGYPTMPHITGMMTQNVLGTPVPPFIIVSDLRRLPDELKELVFAQLIWVGSSTNGYMTRDLFLLWTINFINWLSHYRLGLPSHIRDERALLLLDGHTSRECPLALLLMRRANIDVVVFPSHCTHVMQLFDVVIASPLKSRFSSCFRKVLLAKQEENDSLPEDQRLSNAAVFRYSAVWAFVDCYRSTATTLTCMSGARKTGIYPFNPNEVTSSPFVRDLTPEEQQVVDLRNQRNVNRLSISCKLITDANCIVEISNSVGRNPKFAHLCLQQQYLNMSYTALVGAILSSPRNNGRLLSPLPPFYRKNAEPLFFN